MQGQMCRWRATGGQQGTRERLFMSLVGRLHQEEQGKARAGWRGDKEEGQGSPAQGQVG